MSGSHPERREPPQLERGRYGVRAEEQLEHAGGRLSERERRRDATAAGEPLGRHGAQLARLVERLASELARPTEIGPRLEPERAGQLDLPRGAFPEQADRSADDVRRHPDDLRPGMPLAERGRERVACKLECGTKEQLGRARCANSESAEHERGLPPRQLGGGPLDLRERRTRAIQLECPRRVARPQWDDEDRPGAGAGSCTANALRRTRKIVDERIRQIRSGQVRPVQLGRERGWAGDGNRPQVLTGRYPYEREVGARDDSGRLGDVVERSRERRAERGRGHGAREGLQRLLRHCRRLRLRVDHHRWKYRGRNRTLTLRRWQRLSPTRKRPRSTLRRSSFAIGTTAHGGRRVCGRGRKAG